MYIIQSSYPALKLFNLLESNHISLVYTSRRVDTLLLHTDSFNFSHTEQAFKVTAVSAELQVVNVCLYRLLCRNILSTLIP